jgi:hypothetical protein
MVLSDWPYSGVMARDLGFLDQDWRRVSLTLRIEHEAAHYFTQRVLGSMDNTLHDELLADWAAITAAAGHYRSDWFLRFMGLEQHAAYRAGGRLEQYCDREGLTAHAFRRLQELVRNAASRLEEFDREEGTRYRDDRGRATMLVALAMLTFEELASPGGVALLSATSQRVAAVARYSEPA